MSPSVSMQDVLGVVEVVREPDERGHVIGICLICGEPHLEVYPDGGGEPLTVCHNGCGRDDVRDALRERVKTARNGHGQDAPPETPKGEGFTKAPNAVIKCPDVSPLARLLYVILRSYAWQEATCFPGRERLAADLGVNEKTLRLKVRELEDHRLIHQERLGRGFTNRYTLLPIPEWMGSCGKA